ncbi:hypothetical protein B0O99DRAFT_679601 [Bisporella sp. PMI_857]|nr:hypothetical protein B0O99DRAFT_679601 [Bisporella sp. PMI_857]
MSSSSHSPDTSGDRDAEAGDVNLAQIMADLRKGEKTADVLESHLTNLEKKIDGLLASFEESESSKAGEAIHSKAGAEQARKGDDAEKKS